MADSTDIQIPGTPTCVLQMTDAQLEAHIRSVRERRLKARRIYERDKALKQAARHASDAKKVDAALARVAKQFDVVDKALTKLEEQLSTLRVLRFELTGEVLNDDNGP